MYQEKKEEKDSPALSIKSIQQFKDSSNIQKNEQKMADCSSQLQECQLNGKYKNHDKKRSRKQK